MAMYDGPSKPALAKTVPTPFVSNSSIVVVPLFATSRMSARLVLGAESIGRVRANEAVPTAQLGLIFGFSSITRPSTIGRKMVFYY
jgi:hypothetical protein